MKRILVKGGRIVDPSQALDKKADLLLEDGKVKLISDKPISAADAKVIDATGLIVSPGWVDIHTHLRDPGGANKETIQTGTQSAAAGGFTSIACMANTNPVNDCALVTTYLRQKIQREAHINVFVIGSLTKGLRGEELSDIGSMKDAGIVAVSDDGKTVMNSNVMRKGLAYATRFGLTVITHAEDMHLKGKGVMHEGAVSSRLGLTGVPRTSEDCIVARDIMLAELTGAKLHVAHTSTAGAVELVRQAKKKGLKITAEATPHHLTLTHEAVEHYDTATKVAPPLREDGDVAALRKGVADGTVDALATDHAPHADEDKCVEYDCADFGMIGFETAFPLYYKLVLDGAVSLSQLIACMTVKPAEIINVPKGTLKVGADADVTIFNLDEKWTVDKNGMHSKSHNTPFDRWKMQGRVVHTIVNGNLVFSEGKFPERPWQ